MKPARKEFRELLKERPGWKYERRGKKAAFVHEASGLHIWCSITPKVPAHAVKKIRRGMDQVEQNGTLDPDMLRG